MPQVDAVGTVADPAQRLRVDGAAEPRPGHDAREHGEHCPRGCQQQSPRESGSCLFGRLGRGEDDKTDPEHPEQYANDADAAAQHPFPLRHAPDAERQGDAEQQPERVRVGAEVRARQCTGGDQHRHPPCGGTGRDHGERDESPAHPQHDQQQGEEQRPEQVELLLDGERPHVAEQLRLGRGEVVRATRESHPVVTERRGTQQLPADADQHVAADQPGDGRAHREHHSQRRQQPACPATPEVQQTVPQRMPRRPQHERGDQEAAHHEEDVHADQPAAQAEPGEEVVDQHQPHGDRAEPVEPRVPRQVGRRRRHHS